MNRTQAPILFLFFNRPETTMQVFSKIRLAKPERIYLASDGPRPSKSGELDLVTNLRAKIKHMIDWDCLVFEKYNTTNLGCKHAVSSALTWFFSHEEMGIILEDDCLPSPSFFEFCDLMLQRYAQDTRVSMITGTNYFSEDSGDLYPDYFFSKHHSIWGWATWRRSFDRYSIELAPQLLVDSKKLRYLAPNILIYLFYRKLARSVIYENLDTWDIQWLFHCLLNSGLCLTPSKNLISNIGTVGTHSSNLTTHHFLKSHVRSFRYDANLSVSPWADYDFKLFKNYAYKDVIYSPLIQLLKATGLWGPARCLKRLASRILK